MEAKQGSKTQKSSKEVKRSVPITKRLLNVEKAEIIRHTPADRIKIAKPRLQVTDHAVKIKHGNYEAAAGIRKFSRSLVFRRKALYRYIAKNQDTLVKKSDEEAKPIETEKGRRPRTYDAQRAKGKKPIRPVKYCSKHKRRLRGSIHLGAVLILLAGSHKGKRVVFLKQLASGLLLVTGPFKFNGVPLRRVHQKFVIATRAHVNVCDVEIPSRVDDIYFRRASKEQKKDKLKKSSDLFAKTKVTYDISAERKEDQKAVDSQVLKSIKGSDDAKMLPGYLSAKFSLFKHDLPHRMQF